MKWVKNNLNWLLSIALMLMTLTVFGPIELYLTNSGEFWFDFKEMLKISGILTAVVGIILLGAGLIVPQKAKPFYGTILFVIAVACYIQGNYANIDYGTLDGTTIDWSQYTTYGIVNIVIWLIAVVGAILLQMKKSAWMNKICRWGSVLLIFMLALSLAMIGVTSKTAGSEKTNDYLSVSDMYKVSADENIIIFVLDAFDDAYFQDIYKENPEKYQTMFRDFTYFENASAGGARTKAGMPIIITGKAYPGEVTYAEYIAQAFDHDGLYSELKKQNYNVSLYTEPLFVPGDVETIVNNQSSAGYVVSSYAGLTRKYAEFTLFRYAPHILKPVFWLYTGDFNNYRTGASAASYITNDAVFLKNMNLEVTSDENVFRLFHLNGAHSPYHLDEVGNYVESGTDVLTNAKGALHIVDTYLQQLKQLDVYDNSTIIIMADHGEVSDAYQNEYASHGILFVKERNKHADYSVSSAPVSYMDLHATLFDEIGVESGEGFFEIPVGERTRYFYNLTTEGVHEAFVEYTIDGHMNDTGALEESGNVFTPNITDVKYELGTNLTFGLGGTAAQYYVSGFTANDPSNFAWTHGKEVAFRFNLEKVPKSDLIAKIDLVKPHNEFSSQLVTAYANGMEIHSAVLSDDRVLQFTVPHSVITGEVLELSLALPNAVSPASILGDGFDHRILGLAIKGMCLEEAGTRTQFVQSQTFAEHVNSEEKIHVEFGKGRGAEQYILSGIDMRSDNFSWTDGHRAEMVFELRSAPVSDVLVTMEVIDSYDEQGQQDVQIWANGAICYEGTIEGAQTLEVIVPQSTFMNDALLLTWNLPNAAVPAELTGEGDWRRISLAMTDLTVEYTAAVGVLGTEIEPQDTSSGTEQGFSITDIVAIPLTALMMFCYNLLGNYGLTILIFTVLSKIILLPVSLWVHKNGITMVKVTPEVNRIKIKHFGDKDTIDDETQALYKREKYNPLASTVPMIVQIVMLLGVIGAVKNLLAGADSVLTLVPSEAGGVTYLMPVAAGTAALALGLAQNKLSPLQREQGKKEQWMSNGFSIGISLFLGAFVSLGVGIYWIASNLLSIVQQMLLNVMIRPEKYIDYAALEASKKELASLDSLSAEVSKEDKKREQEDYKRFFSVANKHLVIYSEKSGFYKYYKDVMDFMLKYSNVIIHYVTNDPRDQIFRIAESQPRIKPYYISEKKLITLLMKMDADIVVMTCPDLDRYHLKRSYVRKDIEYVYMFHYPLSTHMVLNTGALDHYDTILCVGDFQFEEIRAAERLYNLPEKKLISAGYGQLEQLYNSYQKMEKVNREKPKILIAPSWQQDNILDSCIDPLLEQLLGKGYEVVIRPHPEYVKRYKPRMDSIVQRYTGHSDLTFELDFTSNNSLFDSDILISDWSGSAYEFSLVTLKPAVFVNTPPKINNPEYNKLNVEPLEFKLRGEVGIQVDPADLSGLDEKINTLVRSSGIYEERIKQIRDKYIAHFGRSGEIGGKYILSQLLERQNKNR